MDSDDKLLLCEGIIHQCFGMATDTKFECEGGHVTKTLSSHIFLNIDQSKVSIEGDFETEVENLIDNIFSEK